ncbi:MAG: hypothetical protein V3T05_08850 [Myxococcota bacterium]
MKRTIRSALAAVVVLQICLACGGGVPVRVRIDEFTMEVSLDDVVDGVFAEMQAQGLFPPESKGLPVLWPDSLPDVKYRALLTAEPVAVDLTPDPDSDEAEKYARINDVQEAIRRIEMNRLILRIEDSSLTVGLPELRLQVADKIDAPQADRLAWRTVGVLPAAEPGFIGDLEFEWLPSGESFLNAQLADEEKEFAMRVQGKLDIDTAANPRMPSGKAVIRLIVVATFFVEPEKAL